MKTYYKTFIGMLLVLPFIFQNCALSQNSIVDCNNYDSLYSSISKGMPASMTKTAFISEFSLVEKSNITIYPPKIDNEGYLVEILIHSLVKNVDNDTYDRNSVLGFILKGCSAVNSKFKMFNNTSCSFYADNLEDALETAKNGISVSIDNKYLIYGSMVDVYKKICSTDKPDPTIVKKPAVYLYPEKTENVSVSLNVNGKITFTEPDYKTGWNVNVTPDGIINNKYDYLFYEADLNKIELPDKGWVVEFKNLKAWFDEYLPKLGLNNKEKEQFEEYWLGKLRKARFYDIRLLDDKFLSENMDLIINPKPETLIRLNFYFKPLDSKIELNAPELKEITRKGFTVIEWGGINGGDLKIIP